MTENKTGTKKTTIIRPHAGFQRLFVQSNVDVVIGGGVLNPQPLDSLIATPNGFVRMDDIKEGDEICDIHGGTQKVLFVIDKGEQECVEFTTLDGRKIQSALSHNWKIKTTHNRVFEWSAEQIIDYIDEQERKNIIRGKKKTDMLHILHGSPVIGSGEYLPMPPYALGYLIGNGSMSGKGNEIYISTSDKEVIGFFEEYGYKFHERKVESNCFRFAFIERGRILYELKEVGLYGKKALDKFIPDIYKRASYEDKILLLQGLFDSDGCCNWKCGSPYGIYSTISERLAMDICEVIRSIGGNANMHAKEPSNIIKGKWHDCHTPYVVNARIKNLKDLFRLERKRNKCKDESERRQGLYIAIAKYELIGKKPCKCINVSGEDHMYITNDYVPTCNCGKTMGAVLATVEPSLDPNWRGLFLRNNLSDIKSGGALLDTFREVYGDTIAITTTQDPRVTFPSGAYVDITHTNDQRVEVLDQRFKGRQYDMIYLDEATGFQWTTFTTIASRNRGKSAYAGKIMMTTNPEREHWLRTFLDWYIGTDGFIIEERSGAVRYFYMLGSDVKSVVWGDSKEEVYAQCKPDIDRKLDKIYGFMKGRDKWSQMIKSFTFLLGRMSENVDSLQNNEGYIGTIAMAGGAEAQKKLEGNWDVSSKDEEDVVLSYEEANSVFTNDPQTNGDKWITVDLADYGTNNFLQLVWDGLHVIDIDIAPYTTPAENANRMKAMAHKHNIGYSHIIYDAVRGRYINDYIQEAIPFESYKAPIGVNALQYVKLKDCCYGKLVWLIKNNGISISDDVASRRYINVAEKTKSDITVQNEFIEEARVIRWADAPNGKKRLLSKKEMNRMLGRGRSMDMLDPMSMRMYPLLNSPDGYELENSRKEYEQYKDDEDNGNRVDIYDETQWF